jgi:endonuclease I
MHTRLLFFFLFLTSLAQAQVQETLFPDLTGDDLLNALVANYKPVEVLGNSESKDTIYAEIYREGDSVRCVYTGLTVYLTPGEDPSQTVFAQNINLEHTYPKAMGAEFYPASSDMHHLHPSRADVNNARSNLPFAEIPDNQTQEWFYQDLTQFGTPSQNIDAYSEVLDNVAFEPREDHKGNVARAIFYFYTMYKGEADMANSNFFPSMRETLCQWNHDDPIDALEYERTWRIASFQEGKPNPFILDCTLPERCYCSDLPYTCDVSGATIPEEAPRSAELKIFPNPLQTELQLRFSLPENGQVHLALYDQTGREITVLFDQEMEASTYQVAWTQPNLPAGIYFWKMTFSSGKQTQILSEKMIVPQSSRG